MLGWVTSTCHLSRSKLMEGTMPFWFSLELSMTCPNNWGGEHGCLLGIWDVQVLKEWGTAGGWQQSTENSPPFRLLGLRVYMTFGICLVGFVCIDYGLFILLLTSTCSDCTTNALNDTSNDHQFNCVPFFSASQACVNDGIIHCQEADAAGANGRQLCAVSSVQWLGLLTIKEYYDTGRVSLCFITISHYVCSIVR